MARGGGSHLLPGGRLEVTLIDWGKDQVLHRVHPSKFKPDQFNSSSAGDARFSPLIASDGRVIATLYAGTTLDCALMETVFHEVPYAPGLKVVSKISHVIGRVCSSVRSPRDLRLIDLSAIPLRKLGIPRSGLIDTDASEYTVTRQWAIALHEQNQEAEGLIWTSRQADPERAIVLFADRLGTLHLETVHSPRSLILADGSACPEVLQLARRLGALVV
jgi:RES domain